MYILPHAGAKFWKSAKTVRAIKESEYRNFISPVPWPRRSLNVTSSDSDSDSSTHMFHRCKKKEPATSLLKSMLEKLNEIQQALQPTIQLHCSFTTKT